MTINPAALKAITEGDTENAMIAMTPGGIEAQEAAGQRALVASTNMPKDMRPGREVYEALGFEFGDDVDDIFISAKLPDGWTRQATSHSMHSDILDDKGRRRVGIFYKAAFYDRRAHANLVSRYQVTPVYPDAPKVGQAMPFVIEDAGAEIHRLGEAPYCKDWEKHDALDEAGVKWLDTNRPDWRDPIKSWTHI